MVFVEYNYEYAIIELFENLGYEYLYGPELRENDEEYTNPLYELQLRNSLAKINPGTNEKIINEAIRTLKDIRSGSIEERNFIFTDYLHNGLNVSYLVDNEKRSTIVKLVDYDNIENNTFQVINQWTVQDKETKRPDIVVFLNGLPLVVMELKSPSQEDVDIESAYRQIRNYIKQIPSLFVYNSFCVISDLSESRAGTITSDFDRFMEWKTVDGDYENTEFASFDVLFRGMFERRRFIDIIRNFVLYSTDSSEYTKILGAYHQYFAVNKAINNTLDAVKGDGRIGVFWHTQGSGKSLSMVFYVNKLQKIMESPTFVVITDRNDLDNQLYSQFDKCSKFLHQSPQQATSRQDLIDLLDNRLANGIFFTTMQKFTNSDEPLTERKDVIVISDEAHRGHYGLETRANASTGEISVGAARRVRNNLPNAAFIGFTGTPIESNDRSTSEIFGNYIDMYDMTQSVEDGATCEIHYESRVVKIKLNDKILEEIDRKYEELAKEAEPSAIHKSKQKLSKMEKLLGAPETIESLTKDLLNHYTEFRMNELEGKTMVVAYSRGIAMKIYDEILRIKPKWKNKVNIVMTSSNDDPEEWIDIIGTKSHKNELARRFKDPTDEFKIAIVVDMWLTGFDVPSLDTMYVYKPMKDHTLMQAIARVNRVYEGKSGGLIVDYIGIGNALRKAMSNYTKRDQDKYGNMDVNKVAYPKFQEILEICQDLFYEFDYTPFFTEDKKNGNLIRAKTISGGLNFIMGLSDKEKENLSEDKIEIKNKEKELKKNEFLDEALKLKQALSLCKSQTTEKERLEAAFFEAIRSSLIKISRPEKLSLSVINKQISELLEHSIQSEGVVNLFETGKDNVNIFDQEFLDRIRNMEQENLAIETLKKLLNDEIKGKTYKLNIVKSEKFSKMLEKIMNRYINGHITNQQVIDELIALANEIKKDKNSGEKLGLNQEEQAFYDAITKPENIKDFYENDELIALTRELTEKLNENRTIDWQKKEGARAGMRRIVKRLLKKHKYPPDGMDYAIDTIIKQCELWTDMPM